MEEDLRQKYNPDGSNLRKAQLCMLGILVEIDKICRAHNIPYWLDSGTLIGAVRHGGFIPWDDDVDICVLRKDYARLRQLLITELPARYIFEDAQTDPYIFDTYGRVKDTSTYCNYPLFRLQKSQGLWVDILVQETAVPLWYKRKVEKLYARTFRERHHFSKSKGLSPIHCAFNTIAAYLLTPIAELLVGLGNLWAKYFGDKNELMHTWDCYHPSRRYMNDIFPLTEITFENRKFFAPHNTDAYLTKIYGDYMTIPDESHRQIHMDTDSLRFFY